MMSTGHVFTRTIAYGLLLGIIDAVAGRLLQAAPDPSIVLSLGGTAWVAYGLAEARLSRIAFPAAVAFWVAFFAAFWVAAGLLIGWNGSVPWHPRSTAWMFGFAVSVPVVALVAQFFGTRAAARGGTNATAGVAPK